MAERVLVTRGLLENIADAIREKTKRGSDGDLLLSAMPDEIRSIGGASELLKALIEGSVEELRIPDGVTRIDARVFQNQLSFRTLIVPDSVTEIESGAFDGCNSLRYIYLPEGIGSFDFKHSGTNTYCLVCYEQAGTNSYSANPIRVYNCQWVNGEEGGFVEAPCSISRFENITKAIVAYFGTESDVTTPGTAGENMALLSYAFNECACESVRLNHIMYTDSKAFYKCQSLRSVTFTQTPDNFAIKSDTFDGCSALTEIHVPWGQDEIAYAPWGATGAEIYYNEGA